jgi:excinuclease ABC subunit C
VFSIVSDESAAYVNFLQISRSHHSLTYHGDKEKLEETDEELLGWRLLS